MRGSEPEEPSLGSKQEESRSCQKIILHLCFCHHSVGVGETVAHLAGVLQKLKKTEEAGRQPLRGPSWAQEAPCPTCPV